MIRFLGLLLESRHEAGFWRASRTISGDNFLKNFLEKFLKEVAWPAMAGNVAWSFATVSIEEGINLCTAPRLGVLFVLAIYLFAEWYRIEKTATTPTSLAYDLVFVICVIWFAIATQANKGMPELALVLILSGVGIGHIWGVWPPAGKNMGNILHGSVSLLAAMGLAASLCLAPSLSQWIALLALLVVLVVWGVVRRKKT